jgi:hypothetical protein
MVLCLALWRAGYTIGFVLKLTDCPFDCSVVRVGIEGSLMPLKGLSSLRSRDLSSEKELESPQRHCVVAPVDGVNL